MNAKSYIGGDYEIAPDGTVTKYLRGGKQVGTSFFISHSDHLGSIQAVTDATGVEVRRQDHTPFGDQHYAWGSHQESKGWIGENEEETELVYLNARYFDPEIGRFTAPDPIVKLGQRLNRYTYSVNNPINFLDRSGLDCVVSHGITFGKQVLRGPVNLGCDDDDGAGASFSEEKDFSHSEKINREIERIENILNRIRERRRSQSTPGGADDPDAGGDDNGGGGSGPDNPLYNCANGMKTNCPGNRSSEAPTSSPEETNGAHFPVVAVVASADASKFFYENWDAHVGLPDVRSYGQVVPVGRLPTGALTQLNKIAGTRLGRFFGLNNPVKPNRGGILQPYNASTGKYLPYNANSLTHSSAARFTHGFTSGYLAAQGGLGLSRLAGLVESAMRWAI